MTRAPRICEEEMESKYPSETKEETSGLTWAGAFSAAKMGTVEPFAPIPIPSRRRTTKSCSQDRLKPEQMGVMTRMMAVTERLGRKETSET